LNSRPTKVKILLHEYTITYVDKPSDVDIAGRESLWGQIDYWTRTIRIYDNKTQRADILHGLLHEILHGITEELHVDILKYIPGTEGQKAHDAIDLLALGLADVLLDNGWITFDGEGSTRG
jgi:hypothetical protein